jgi:hypothetical protein
MATIQVILAGSLTTTIHDTFDYPLVLQFGEQTSYERAVWVIPSYPRRIPAGRLSEIRVQQGPLQVLVDGPEGFRSGPHTTDWVRGFYPRGKDCAFVRFGAEPSKAAGGVCISVVEGSLVIDELPLAISPTPESQT